MTSIIPYEKNIDVVCPVVEKDIPKLALCLQTWRKYVYPHIDEIFIVSPYSKNIVDFANNNNLVYINENEYLGCDDDLLLPIREDRRGWIKQQLIKLNGNLGKNDNTLVIDADVFLMRNHTFIDNNATPHFYMNRSYWSAALDTASRLLGMKPNTELSYVTDKMLFNKGVLRDIKRRIEEVTGKEWKNAIISAYDNSTSIGFSEYELYGMYYGINGIEETSNLIRAKWKDDITYSKIRNKYFVFDQVTFE